MIALETIGNWLRRPRAETSGLANPRQWLVDWVRGGDSPSGMPVNRSSALGYAALWRAVHLLSADVAKTPLFVYKVTGEMGGRERYTAHPVFTLLRRQANPFMTAATLKRTLTAHALLLGSGYGWIRRDGAGVPYEIIPLAPENTRVDVRGGVVRYKTRIEGTEYDLATDEVLHVKGLSHDGLQPYSLIDRARESLGLALAEQRFASMFYANDARPSVVLEHPGKLGDKAAENLRKTFQRQHGSIDKKFTVAVAEEGMKVTPLTISQKDAEFIASVELSIRQVSNWTGVPPHKLGDTTRTSYNSLEQEQQRYLDEGLDPWFCDWEDECWAKLLTEAEKEDESVKIEFLRESLVRVNMKQRAEIGVQLVNNGIRTVDEERAGWNLPPVPNGEGKKHRIPANLEIMGEEKPASPPMPFGRPVDDEDEDDGEDGRENREDDDEARDEGLGIRDECPHPSPLTPHPSSLILAAQREMIVDVSRRMVTRITDQARRAAAKGPTALQRWRTEKMVSDNLDVCQQALLPSVRLVSVYNDRPVDELSDQMLRRLFERIEEAYRGIDAEQIKRKAAELCELLPEELAEMVIVREYGLRDQGLGMRDQENKI